MAKKFFIETYGCQMNDLDSEKMAGDFCRHGMEAAADVSQANIIILNTCSVREKAVQKVYARLGTIKGQKTRRPDLVVGVVGCMAQLEGEEILKRAPLVNILAGPQSGHAIHDLVQQSERASGPLVALRTDADPAPLETPYVVRGNSWSAGVTISEGCDRQCAFCVVPLARGRERTRGSADIIREVKDLAARGYIEIVLLGQTVNSYVDRSGDPVNFAQLLQQVAGISGLRRIRFTSPHPVDFSDALLDVMASCPNVCNHIHLPVQSGSNKVLRLMRRGYTRERYLKIIEKIRNAPREIAVSTDIIVGFPGESEEDFRDTLSLLDEVQYDSAFSFKYSPRPNTAALGLQDEVPDEEKRRRLELVQEKQRLIQSSKNAAYTGRVAEVLVDGKARSRHSLAGRTSDNKVANFDGPDSLRGRIVQVAITGFGPNSLKGTWIHEAAAQ